MAESSGTSSAGSLLDDLGFYRTTSTSHEA